QVSFDKVLAVALTDDDLDRRSAENEMVRQIKNTHAVASHTLLSKEERRDSEEIKNRLRADGFDGVVILQLVGMGEKVGSMPGAVAPFFGLYAPSMPVAYAVGTVRAASVFRVETRVYSLREDKLIWSAETESLDPKTVAGLVVDIAGVVGREL